MATAYQTRAATLVTVLGVAVLGSGGSVAQAPAVRLDAVLTVNLIDLTPTADVRAFERQEITRDPKEPAPGRRPDFERTLLRADRGASKGQYASVMTSKPLEISVLPMSIRTTDNPFVARESGVREYHLVSQKKVWAVPASDVLGIHRLKVKPNQAAAFKRFVRARLQPAVVNLRPDLSLLYYEPVRPDMDPYLAVFALTRASRDKYWPNGSDSAEVKAAFAPLKSLAADLRPYLVDGSYLADEHAAAAVFESRDWTDYVLIPPIRE
jgi:hypothetical protein